MKRLVATLRGDIMMPHNYTRRRTAEGVRLVMQHIGIDVHKNSCQVCILLEAGESIKRRIKTERSSLHPVRRQAAGAHPHRVFDRERMGGSLS